MILSDNEIKDDLLNNEAIAKAIVSLIKDSKVVLCQDLVQAKMRNFFRFKPARSSASVCVPLYIRLAT